MEWLGIAADWVRGSRALHTAIRVDRSGPVGRGPGAVRLHSSPALRTGRRVLLDDGLVGRQSGHPAFPQSGRRRGILLRHRRCSPTSTSCTEGILHLLSSPGAALLRRALRAEYLGHPSLGALAESPDPEIKAADELCLTLPLAVLGGCRVCLFARNVGTMPGDEAPAAVLLCGADLGGVALRAEPQPPPLLARCPAGAGGRGLVVPYPVFLALSAMIDRRLRPIVRAP